MSILIFFLLLCSIEDAYFCFLYLSSRFLRLQPQNDFLSQFPLKQNDIYNFSEILPFKKRDTIKRLYDIR